MIKKYILFIVIGLLVSYALFDFLTKEKEMNIIMKNASEKEIINEQKTRDQDTSDNLDEKNVIESNEALNEIEVASEFELLDLTGTPIKLSDLKGKIVILNFWATWCPPCREEMPHMQSFYEKNKDSDIEILAVNLTNADAGQQAVEKFVQDYELTFPVLLDEDGYVGMTYEIMTIPTSYIIDKEGRIFQKVIGSIDEQTLTDMVNTLRMYNEE